MVKRQSLMKIHVLLAAFILPAALMFFVTGALYTWGVKGSYDTDTYTITLQQPLQPNLNQLLPIAKQQLADKGLSEPTGNAGVKKLGTSFAFSWSGSNRDMSIAPTANPLKARVAIKDTSLYRHFVQLHKAKGGVAFKVYAAFFAVGLLVILLSGFVMAWQTPKLKKLTLISTVIGAMFFVLMACIA
ncbi:Uncharacterised protein [BD1-7 clade bacterium]|uniref:PepSY domain-containing protein n=1 Tax=BD1-7 clade bacterium TaxID=2029982 RepID=A0A5S9PBY5_9GAMM|nr:Uncharacterised protein [BD1-7 clade bacterium]CAA0101930.1 Uncharacterised protein [BD1-7 clade bacterium]